MDLVGLLALGFAAGMAGGLLGVGGGILFVPALVIFAHESQLEAVATSLVAIVLMAIVGAWRQREYGNLRLRDGSRDRGAVAARRARRRAPGERGSRASARALVRRRPAHVRLATRGKGGTALGSVPVEILDVETEDRNGLVHVALKGELDLSTVAKVQDELRRVEADEPAVVVLDLSRLTFLDSTGLRCLVTADERARDAGRRVVIVRGPEPVQRVFTITRLEERLEMVDDASAVN